MPEQKKTRTVGGKAITDEAIQHLADEAEAGYDVAALVARAAAGPSAPQPPVSCPFASTQNLKTHLRPGPKPTTPTPAKSSETRYAPGFKAPNSPTHSAASRSPPSPRDLGANISLPTADPT